MLVIRHAMEGWKISMIEMTAKKFMSSSLIYIGILLYLARYAHVCDPMLC